VKRKATRRVRVSSGKGEAVWFCLLAGLGAAKAQNVIAPPPSTMPQYSVTPPALQEYETNEMQVFSPSGPAMGEETQPLTWNFVTLHPHVYYSFVSSSGVESAPGLQQNTIVQTISPGMLFLLGDHWTLDYTPTLSYYSSSEFQNTLAEAVQLNGVTAYEDWVFTLSQGYNSSSQPLVQTGVQTSQEDYATGLSAAYQINSKLSLSLSGAQTLNYVENTMGATNAPSATRTWSTLEALSYQFWPRFNVGINAGYGYINQEGGTDMMYEQYGGQANWRATDKLSFSASAGLQDYQFLASNGASDILSPVFSAGLQYQPFDQTKLSLSANRTVSSSYYFVDEATETSQVSADLNQRLLGKLTLDVSGGYVTDKYTQSLVGLTLASRHDDYYTFSVSLSYPFLKRGTLSAFYSYSENTSNQSGFLVASSSVYSFNSSQAGFSISYRY
jgi:hypothetical protein